MQEKRPILIQGAMEIEIGYLKEVVSNLEELGLYGYKFYKGVYEEYPVIISKTNIGLIESAIATFIGITNFNPVAVINQGTAGACTKDIRKGDIVIGSKCININSYITAFRAKEEGSLPLDWELLTFKDGKDELIELRLDKKFINIVTMCKQNCKNENVIVGTIGSADMWDKEIDRLEWFNEKYGVLCEDMETASVYTVCNKLDVPVIGVRVISNNEILKEEFEENIALKSQKFAIKICKELIKNLKENT